MSLSVSVQAEKIVIGADSWQNFTNDDGSGIYFDLLKRIYGQEILSFEVDGYHRNLKSFELGKLDILVGVYREDVSQALLPNWFLDTDGPVLAFHKPGQVKIKYLSDFEKLNNSWVRGYHFERFLHGGKNSYPVNKSQDGFRLLAGDKIDTFIDYSANVPPNLAKQFSQFEILPSRHIYVAFQRNKRGKKLAEQFDSMMSNLRKSGELAEIYGQYYPTTGLVTFNENKTNIVVLTDEVNLLNERSETVEKTNDTLSKTLHLIFDQLNNYTFEFQLVNDYSNISQYQSREGLCLSDMIKTNEREKYFHYSIPSSLYFGLQLFSKEPIQVTGETANLTQLLTTDSTHKIGIVQGRSYGKKLDNIIKELPAKHIVDVPAKLASIVAIFAHDRFDLLLEYPQNVNAYWHQISKSSLYSYPVADGIPYISGHMICTKTEKNSQFIEDYNSAVSNLAKSGALLQSLSKNIEPSSRKAFRQYFLETYQIGDVHH